MIDNFTYINGGGTGTLIRKEIYANGTYHAEDDNADGYSDVTVNIPMPVMINEKTVTDNGTYTASDEDAYGYKKVIVNLPLGTKSVTENGTYNASGDSLKGYSSVSVNVPVPDLTALSVTENGTYHPASGTVYNEVEVQVPQQTIMQRKTIYTNGLYTASTDDNVDGYGEVYVNVPSSGLTKVDLADQAAYDALSTAEKQDATKIYFIINEPRYNWYYNNDRTLVVRENLSDGTYRWYINGFQRDSSSSYGGRIEITGTLAQFIDFHHLPPKYVNGTSCPWMCLTVPNTGEQAAANSLSFAYNVTNNVYTKYISFQDGTDIHYAIVESSDFLKTNYIIASGSMGAFTTAQIFADTHPWETPTFDPIYG